jgi:hypothetical protein
VASEGNPFSSKPSLASSDSTLFKSKEFFSELYNSNDWDYSALSKPATDDVPSKTMDTSISKSQEFIPKLVENMDWDTELCMEDVKATAQELAKQSFITSSSEIAIPKPSSFSDAFKSQDWSIIHGTIPDDIDYTPEMLEKALVHDCEPVEVTPNIFSSRDWTMPELLGSHKDITLSPQMFHLNDPTPKAPKKDKTDWETFLTDQLAPAATASPMAAEETKPKKKRQRKKRKKMVPERKEYVDVSYHDVLLGRGGKSNHHPGNKRYREDIENFRTIYATLDTDKEKTEMSQTLVDVIKKMGGRFLEEDKVKDVNGKTNGLGWYAVPNIVARRKASQALREDNDPEKRKAKRARFVAKKKAVRGY